MDNSNFQNVQSECDFLVDYENGQESDFEPIYSQNKQQWETEFTAEFLDAPRSHKLYRAFYLPFTRENTCFFGNYVLLRNINKRQRK